MATVDFIGQIRNEIGARLAQLRPLVDEYQRLGAAAAALASLPPTSPRSSAPARSARRTRAPAPANVATVARTRGASHRPRGRPKGSGTRSTEALAVVKAHPGITIPQIAEQLGIKQDYLYRILPRLAEDGLVVKDGRGWKPKDAA